VKQPAAAQISYASRSSSALSISASVKMPSSSIWRSPFPVPPQSGSPRSQRKFERRAAGLYHNTVAMLESDGSLSGIYRKMHIPDDPLYYEKFYFTPGDLGFKSFDTSVGQVGALICWDQWYPEAARITALRGANLLFYPTAIGWHPAEKEAFGVAQYEAWQTIQRAHAIANGVYVAAVNRVGHEQGDVRGKRAPGVGLEFWGGSFIADPFGRVLAQAPHDSEAILIEEVDLTHLEDTRRNWPFLRDRRIDFYPPITARYLDEPTQERKKTLGNGH
jgi:N-carbamoylputrescine amidase